MTDTTALDMPTVAGAIETANAIPDDCWLTAGPYNVIYMGEVRALLAEVDRLRADIATWGLMWNDAELLTARVEALRDGTADLG